MRMKDPTGGWWISRRSFTQGLFAWFSLPWIVPRLSANTKSRVAPEKPSRFINPLIGASTSTLLGKGKTFPAPTTPFGMAQLSPEYRTVTRQ